MFFVGFLLFAVAIFYWIATRPVHWLKVGKPHFSKTITLNKQTYDIEEVGFADYQQALHHYVYIAQEIAAHANVLEVKYDYLDWTNTLFRFEHYTLHLARQINKIRLVKSHSPIELHEFEQDLIQLNQHF